MTAQGGELLQRCRDGDSEHGEAFHVGTDKANAPPMKRTFSQRAVTIAAAALLCFASPPALLAQSTFPSLIETIENIVGRIAAEVRDKNARALLKDAEKALSNAGKKSRGGREPGGSRPALEQAHALLRAALFSSAGQTPKQKQDIEEALTRLAPVLGLAGGYPTSLRTADAVHEARFQTPEGAIVVRLPSDMSVGDTISGTLEGYASGLNPSEQSRNLGMLDEAYRIGIEPAARSSTPAPAASGDHSMILSLRNRSGELVSTITVPVADRPTAPAEKTYSIPNLAAAGKPVLIRGPFDGGLETTRLAVNGEILDEFSNIPGAGGDVGGVVLNLEKISVRPGQNLYPIAESPRGLALLSGAKQSGPYRVQISEGARETACQAHLLGIDLIADKIALLKGETTHVHLTIRGLFDVKQPVGVHLQNSSRMISLEGGNAQDFTIAPHDVPSSGEVSFSRAATGITAGDWSMSATLDDASTRPVACTEPLPAITLNPPAAGRRPSESSSVGKTTGRKEAGKVPVAPLTHVSRPEIAARRPQTAAPLTLETEAQTGRRVMSSVLLSLAAFGLFLSINRIVNDHRGMEIDIGSVRRKPLS